MSGAFVAAIILGTIGTIAWHLRQKYPNHDTAITLLCVVMMFLAPFIFVVLLVVIGSLLGAPLNH